MHELQIKLAFIAHWKFAFFDSAYVKGKRDRPLRTVGKLICELTKGDFFSSELSSSPSNYARMAVTRVKILASLFDLCFFRASPVSSLVPRNSGIRWKKVARNLFKSVTTAGSVPLLFQSISTTTMLRSIFLDARDIVNDVYLFPMVFGNLVEGDTKLKDNGNKPRSSCLVRDPNWLYVHSSFSKISNEYIKLKTM